MEQQRVFFIAVTDDEGSKNRAYSNFMFIACHHAMSSSEKIKQKFDVDNFVRHDMLPSGNLKDSIYGAFIEYGAFVVLLDNADGTYNPNVWFELGIASTQDKPIVLIAQENTEIPFHANDVNVIKIDSQLMQSFEKKWDSYKTDSHLEDQIELWKSQPPLVSIFENHFTKRFIYAMENGTPFNRNNDSARIKELGFGSLMHLFKDSEIIDLIKNPVVRADYINGEEDAFKELIKEVSNAQSTLRTSRFANQSIVAGERTNKELHDQFMATLAEASKRVSKCDRIICNNHPLKWNDVLDVLVSCNDTMRVFIRKNSYSIGFELVIIDEKVAFIHFYQIDRTGDKNQNGETYEHEREVINSTLKIRGYSVCSKLASIFDRLHHRDFDMECKDPSRTLLGVPQEDKLTNEQITRGVFHLEGQAADTGDNQRKRRKTTKVINLFKQAFESWDLEFEDKKNMAVGICLLDDQFESSLPKYFNESELLEIKKELDKHRKE